MRAYPRRHGVREYGVWLLWARRFQIRQGIPEEELRISVGCFVATEKLHTYALNMVEFILYRMNQYTVKEDYDVQYVV